LARLSGKGDQNGHNPIEDKPVVDHEINIRNDMNQRDLKRKAVWWFSGFSARALSSLLS
jgi:hypothetical protein